MRHIFKNGIDYLSSRWCSKGVPCLCSHPWLSVQRQLGGLAAPTRRHHLRMIRVQSSLTTWILYCILILVLSNFSKVETLTSDKIKFTKAGSTWSGDTVFSCVAKLGYARDPWQTLRARVAALLTCGT